VNKFDVGSYSIVKVGYGKIVTRFWLIEAIEKFCLHAPDTFL